MEDGAGTEFCDWVGSVGEEDMGSMRPSDVGLVVEDDSVGWELEEEFVGFCLLCAEPMTKKKLMGEGRESRVIRGIWKD